MPVTGCHLDNLSLTEDRLPPYIVNTKAFKTTYTPGLLSTTPSPWLTQIRLTRISLTRIF